MKHYEVSVERRFPVSPERVYDLIVDMERHRRILPKQFESFEVLAGGRGDGTVFRLTMNVMGNRSSLVMTLKETEPGRVVHEKDERAGIMTTWELAPEPGGGCRLRLTSLFPGKAGLAGWMERVATSSLIRSIYRRELENMHVCLTTGTFARE